jgi:hypothetical protein
MLKIWVEFARFDVRFVDVGLAFDLTAWLRPAAPCAGRDLEGVSSPRLRGRIGIFADVPLDCLSR